MTVYPRYHFDFGEYVALAGMGLGAGGMVYCGYRVIEHPVNWGWVGFAFCAAFTVPLMLQVAIYGLRELVNLRPAPALPDAPRTNGEAPPRAALDENDAEAIQPPPALPRAIQGRSRPLDIDPAIAVLRGRVTVFLRECIAVAGETSQIIPTYRRLGWEYAEWAEMVNALGGHALVQERRPTLIFGYENLRELLRAVTDGMNLYPPRPGPPAPENAGKQAE